MNLVDDVAEILISEEELKEKLRTGAVTDGFTQSAVLLYLLKIK